MEKMFVFSQAVIDKDGYINLIYRGPNGDLHTVVTCEKKVIYKKEIEKFEI